MERNSISVVEVINRVICDMDFERYLEVGVAYGNTFNRIICRLKYGMDPALPPGVEYLGKVFKLTSDQYFMMFPVLKYDLIFIDGLHLHEQVSKDMINCYNNLSTGGFLIMHDCRPLTKEAGGRYYEPPMAWNGDIYKAVMWFRKAFPSITQFTLDTDHGLGVIYKREDSDIKTDFSGLKEFKDVPWEWLKDNWSAINLVEPGYIFKFMEEIKNAKGR